MATAVVETRRAVPEEIRGKWNWGAFLLTVIWAFAHRLYWQGVIALLLGWIPVVGFLPGIWLGLKGNEYAWQAGDYASVEAYRERQRKWTIAGVIVIGAFVAIGVVAVAAGA